METPNLIKSPCFTCYLFYKSNTSFMNKQSRLEVYENEVVRCRQLELTADKAADSGT